MIIYEVRFTILEFLMAVPFEGLKVQSSRGSMFNVSVANTLATPS
jgi:hypothetical protein